MSRVRLTVAAAIVVFLKQQWTVRDGIERRLVRGVAGIFGHGNVAGLGQALEEHGGDALPFWQPKNEQAMVHAAAAFAKTHQRLSTLACTTSVGPGATNLVTGAAGATINRLPVLLLPGDVFASRLPDPVLQQLEHPTSLDTSVNDCLRPVSKLWDRIVRPEQVLRALPEAMRVLASPVETGAVTLCLPEDVQAEAWDWPARFFARRVWTVPRPRAGTTETAAAAVALRAARRPFLVAGGGVHYADATAALVRFVERAGIPVGCTQAGKGALLDAHPLCMGGVGVTGTAAANALARDADLVLAVGTRLSDFTTASRTLFQHADVRFVAIQIHPGDAHKLGALPLVGDARVILDDLAAALGDHTTSSAYRREIAEAKAAWDLMRSELVAAPDAGAAPLHQTEVLGILNAAAGADATVVHAAGGLPGDLHKLWHCASAAHLHSEYGYSCMGYEIAGALGVKMAQPDRDVYAFVGDGSYLMLHGELVTALQEGLKITVVLVDNGGYQCIHGLQRGCGGRSFGNEFRARTDAGRLDGATLDIDYAANARSLGAAAWRATTAAELRAALAAARAETRACLVHVPVEPRAVPSFAWWDVPGAEVSAVPSVLEARRRYDEARRAQRDF
jgi:3D-(3,5/4)-trihydroxycyclohexane-1,2-dione acylhydrolase (decyclizing)